MVNFCWEPEAIAELERLWRAGFSQAEISRRFGVTVNQVARRLTVTGIRANFAKEHVLAQAKNGRHKPKEAAFAKIFSHEVKSKPPVKEKKMRGAADMIAEVAAEKKTYEAPEYAPLVSSVIDLEHGMCRWPVGEVSLPGFGFCGRKALIGKTYCAAHEKLSKS
jgi:GcrA cell cycle regulator